MSYKTINDYYHQVTEAVFDREPFGFFEEQYYIRVGIPEGKLYDKWIDYLLDSYNKYRSCGFVDFEAQINSLMDGLEGLLK